MSLRDLYQEMIIDHGRKPRNFGKLEKPSHTQAGHNPLCGDKLKVYVLVCDGVIEDLCFEGVGCAISVASASLMTEAVKGKTVDEMHCLFDGFHQLVTAGGDHEQLGKLAVFSGVAEFPIRVKCATLAWHTLKAAIAKDPKTVCTE